METFKEIITFFTSYETWVNIGMTACVVLFFILVIFGPKKKGEGQAVDSLVSIVNQSKKRSEFKARVLQHENQLPDHLKKLQRFKDVDFLWEIEIDQLNFDLLVYLHNKEPNQQAHILLLIDFYDPGVSPVWNQLDDKWNKVRSRINYPVVKSFLQQAKGFRSQVEYLGGFGGDMVYKPRVMYVQVAGRRSTFSQEDMGRMQEKYFPQDRELAGRILSSYDYLLDGFVPLYQ